LEQFYFERLSKGGHTKCNLKLVNFDPGQSHGNFRNIKKTSHEEWVKVFNEEMRRLYSEKNEAEKDRSTTTDLIEDVHQAQGGSNDDDGYSSTQLNSSLEIEVDVLDITDTHEDCTPGIVSYMLQYTMIVRYRTPPLKIIYSVALNFCGS